MPSQTLLSFRAGKMTRENETSNTVVPDLRKGYIQLLTEDDLLHFQWKERSATEAEDDLIIFPEDARFIRVPEAADGRVYMLRFESSKAKHFFWMQDKSEARDTWLVDRVNTLIDNPDAPAPDLPNGDTNPMADLLTGVAGNRATRGPMQNAISEELINNTIAGFSGEAEAFWEGMQGSGIGREELMQMLASEMQPTLRDTLLTRRDPSLSIPQTPSASQQPPLFSQSSQQPLARSQQTLELPAGLQEQIASITAGLSGATSNPGTRREYIALNDVLTRDMLTRVLQMPGIGERLRPGMPENWDEGNSSVDEVVQSPQFQQALSSLSSAISTGQLTPLLQQFGLQGNIDDVESFLRALEEQVRREQGEGPSEESPEDERMQED